MTSSLTERKEIKRFGAIAFVFFGCLCGLGVYLKKPISIYLFGALAIFGFGFFILPTQLKPLYSRWMKVARLIGKLITIFILTVAYYSVITPTALIKRLFGGRPLPIKPDKESRTYWVTRNESMQPRKRFIKRF
jgi:hypothetical protein